ncbi:MAG: hypothetical protein EB060_01555 [Proteobacteria bacterium]|nr:hypothetical protein [Pseudomonadota bacterium]
MFFDQEQAVLKNAQQEAKLLLSQGEKPRIFSKQHLGTFSSQMQYSLALIAEEKEILFFAFLQWVAIFIGYLLWVQMLDWIPDSVWQEIQRASDHDHEGGFKLMNLVLLCWSFLIVAMVSYPISLFSAAMVASHYLRLSAQESTIGRCLGMAHRNLGRLWIFTTIDAWITVGAILDRLPKKHGRRTAFDELLYYAWKIGTMGVLPALVTGKGFLDAAKDSVILLKTQPARAIGIRMGYSLVCWVIGITAYIGSFYYFQMMPHAEGANRVYNFYFFMVVPIMLAVGLTAVLVRPLFLIMSARLYTDVVPFAKVTLPPEHKASKILVLIFSVLVCVIVGAVMFAKPLGLVDWIESLAAQDILQYRKLHP